eukprot:1134494-Pelagomonas_calceolata.AAC.3
MFKKASNLKVCELFREQMKALCPGDCAVNTGEASNASARQEVTTFKPCFVPPSWLHLSADSAELFPMFFTKLSSPCILKRTGRDSPLFSSIESLVSTCVVVFLCSSIWRCPNPTWSWPSSSHQAVGYAYPYMLMVLIHTC